MTYDYQQERVVDMENENNVEVAEDSDGLIDCTLNVITPENPYTERVVMGEESALLVRMTSEDEITVTLTTAGTLADTAVLLRAIGDILIAASEGAAAQAEKGA